MVPRWVRASAVACQEGLYVVTVRQMVKMGATIMAQLLDRYRRDALTDAASQGWAANEGAPRFAPTRIVRARIFDCTEKSPSQYGTRV